MIVDKLYESVAQKGVVCVGLDTDISYVPEYLRKEAGSAGEAVFLFNKAIIDATEDVAGCYKVQIAYYESLGLEGMEAALFGDLSVGHSMPIVVQSSTPVYLDGKLISAAVTRHQFDAVKVRRFK